MTGKHLQKDAARYGGALLAVAAAVFFTRILSSFGDSGISPLFFAAVLISAGYGGLGPGLVATAASGMATAYLLMPHVNSFAGVRDAVLRVVVFTIVALLASSLNAATKRASEAFRKARDAAEEASAAKTRFLAMVSHELRTPLAPIIMVAEAMREDQSLPTAVQSDISTILRCVDIEVRLIDDLVDLSRISSGKLHLDLRTVDVHEPLAAAIRLCESDISERQIELAVDLAAERGQMVGDSVRLQQIFWNLIRNAVKFTPEGGRVAITTSNDAAGNIIAQISDTGIGINPEQLSTIFQAFNQGGPDITARFGGLGLGLAICQALAEAQGGHVTAASDGPGMGATFRVSFPSAGRADVARQAESPVVHELHQHTR